jgi:hypothetical protein
LIAVAAMVAAVLACSYLAWRRWGDLVTERRGLLLTAQNMETTPQPPWIRTDVRAEVSRDGALHNLSILHEKVTVQVARAFALHPWVAEVVRVSKHHPSRVVVQLRYRRPVAAVEVLRDGQWGVFAVDADGVLLPREDFAHDDHLRNDYLRVWAGDTWPAGPEGTPWGDRRVAGAARIADAIGPAWKQLGLYRIKADSQRGGGRDDAEPVYQLFTPGNRRIVWGRAPGREGVGEPASKEKLARLMAYVKETGPLDNANPSGEIDLSSATRSLATPRTAQRAQD